MFLSTKNFKVCCYIACTRDKSFRTLGTDFEFCSHGSKKEKGEKHNIGSNTVKLQRRLAEKWRKLNKANSFQNIAKNAH